MTFSWDSIQQFVRICMGWLAAYLVTKGIATEEMANTLTGGLIGVVQFAWWYFWNNKRPA